MTVSAYIVLVEDGSTKCLVHFHKKIQKLMQIGGHIELDETPWQSVQHEVLEESGYELEELEVLQPSKAVVKTSHNVAHPVPMLMNTHYVGDAHYHSDLCYAFVATARPKGQPSEGESTDLRWLTFAELQHASSSGEALEDVVLIYEYILEQLNVYEQIPGTNYSLAKPGDVGVRYKSIA